MPYTGNPNYANPNMMNPGMTGFGMTNPGMVAPNLGATAATAVGPSSALGLNDRDLFDILLSQHKLLAETMTQTILESANPQFRQDCINILNRDFMHQRMIWEAMNQRGWYSASPGSSPNIGQQQPMGMNVNPQSS